MKLAIYLGLLLILMSPLVIAESYEEEITGSWTCTPTMGGWSRAQSIKAYNSSLKYLAGVSLYIDSSQLSPNGITAHITNASSGKPDYSQSFADISVDDANLTISGWNDFNVTGSFIELTPGTTYTVAFDSYSGAERYLFCQDSGNPYSNGNSLYVAYANRETSGSWVDESSYDTRLKFHWYDGSEPSSNPVLTNINCTSSGDSESPYTTHDTTPTFTFTTDVNANCRIGNVNFSYSNMGDARNCTEGQGAKSHTCTLPVSDGLSTSSAYVYIGCASSTSGEEGDNASVSLLMDITNLEVNNTLAIQYGVQASSIWPSATLYDNQQVYLRNAQGTELLTTVDVVAAYGNQRWLFHAGHDDDVFVGLFNISPAVYVFEMLNWSFAEIRSGVAEYIDETKN